MYHGQADSYSSFFSNPNHHESYQQEDYDQQYDTYSLNPNYSYSSPLVVDCTLSLGTPSTRCSTTNQDHEKRNHERSSSITNFSWNSKNKKGGGTNNNDSLLARRCANCDTTSTPLWRNGPRGPKSLCNACGIRYKKEERRANAATAAAAAAATSSDAVMEPSGDSYSHYSNNSPWYPYPAAHVEEDSYGDSEFLSWRLNVADRTTLVHDFTT